MSFISIYRKHTELDDYESPLVIIYVAQISYILIEDHLKSYNFKFVLTKKKSCLGVAKLGWQFSLRGSLIINWKKC